MAGLVHRGRGWGGGGQTHSSSHSEMLPLAFCSFVLNLAPSCPALQLTYLHDHTGMQTVQAP